VEDYHVDRLGVEVQQCMKLTSTNSPIGLIVLIAYVHRTKFDALLGLALTRWSRLRAGRATRRDGLWPVWDVPRRLTKPTKRVQKQDKMSLGSTSFSFSLIF
jgi:hypothetical protein